MGKPQGTYITIEAPDLSVPDEDYPQGDLGRGGTSFEGADRSRTAAVDPGGRPWKSGDHCGFLGPRAVSNLHMTRHVIREYGLKSNEHMKMHQISGIVPGVMAQTGMELWKLFGVLFLRQSRMW